MLNGLSWSKPGGAFLGGSRRLQMLQCAAWHAIQHQFMRIVYQLQLNLAILPWVTSTLSYASRQYALVRESWVMVNAIEQLFPNFLFYWSLDQCSCSCKPLGLGQRLTTTWAFSWNRSLTPSHLVHTLTTLVFATLQDNGRRETSELFQIFWNYDRATKCPST